MKCVKSILSIVLGGMFFVTGAFAQQNCDDSEYRKNHPEKCEQNTFEPNTVLTLLGGTALVGFGAAMAAQTFSSGSGHTSEQTTYPRFILSPNININYSLSDTITNQYVIPEYLDSLTNGDDIDASVISEIKSSDSYVRNYQKFDNINFAWAYARGFTGKDININVIDDFAGTHGYSVQEIAQYIAPDANIYAYNIANSANSLTSFDNIANTLRDAPASQIYNASWQILSTDNQNAAVAIYNSGNSLKTYAQAQDYLYNATSQNLITQIRNIAIENDAIFVWAAGNDSHTESGVLSALPIAFPDLGGHFVNVVAVNDLNQIAWYSNQCGITQNYCIAAPGSGWETDAQSYASGTSFAAPAVSGAIATIKEAFPYMNANQITELLFTTATDLGETGVDSVYGWGLLNMEKATQPVGVPRIILSNETIKPLGMTNISGIAAGAIKNANVKLAFFDDFGRAFTTNLSDNINVVPYGRGFDRLRETDTGVVSLSNGFEFGFKQNNILQSNGLISMKSNDLINFVGYTNTFDISGIQFYQQVRIGLANPYPEENSMVSDLSKIYTQSIKTGIKFNDFTFEFAIPDRIISGNMNLTVPVARANDGRIIYSNVGIDLATKPSTEYTIKYRNLSATYINNPDWQDEFFVTAKIKGVF